ncbi:MAG: glycosyltransferase family 4 protein, partial [Chloroflexi bacterium]|nr:glycosyltransferase family 4 protein [Chloroflexota bacterium]
LPGAGRVPGLLTLGQVEIALLARRHGLELLHDPVGVYPFALAGCARVVTVHDAFPCVRPQTSTALERLLYRYWLPVALGQAGAVITVSAQSQADILRYYALPAEKVTVIPIARDPRFCPLPPEAVRPVLERHHIRGAYILYVGSLQPRKNLLRLLAAYRRLRAWSPGWRLVIVGARNYRQSIPVVAAIQDLGLEEWVQFTGFVEEEDLPALYNGADLFVFPSLYEGFGLPPLEAMACGVPVVTSNVSSLPEVVGDAALLVDPYQEEQIYTAMRRVLEDPQLAEDLRHKGLQRAARFTWQRMAEETLAVYREVLHS